MMSAPMVSPVSSTSLETLAASASAAILEATELLDVHGSSSWLGIIGRSILVILQLISSIIYWSLRLTTFSLPTIIFTTLSASWTVTMNATTLMIIVVLFCSAVAWVVRYRFLNMYSRLPHEPQRKEPNVDLPPDSHDEGVKSGFSNYLDEFLSAIKIFGYLERPVFHELTRSMQTKRLVAGEAVNLEEEKGFCIVVDGLVEIFVKSGPRSSYDDAGMDESEYSDYDYQQNSSHQYQLLTEVRNGTPMSSLFSIMSLFTEDINLGPGDSENKSSTPFSPTDSFSGHNKNLSSAPGTPPMRGARSAHLQSPVRMDTDNQDIPTIDLSEVADESLSGHHRRRLPLRTRGTSKSAHPDIIARATTDTTLAIIPASAFRRLIKVYPKATAHIVHVILSRFQRVTLSNAYNYLGLTDDVIRTESSMTRFTFCQLPNDLRGEALNRLKEKFRRERDNSRENGEDPKVIALHNPTIGRRRRSSAGLRKEAVLQSLSRQITDGPVGSTITRPRDRGLAGSSDIMGPNRLPHRVDTYGTAPRSPFERPGRGVIDPFAKQGSRKSIDPRESVNEDNVFRASVLECMFCALGLGQSGLSSDGAESHEGSPKINSFDLRYRPGPTNAFGLMGPLETGSGGDTESQTSGSTSAFHSPSAHVLASDMRDDLEILYFPKGSVLVEEGEHSTGLYYVIDGFLDMGTTKTELSAGIIEVDPSSYMPASPLNSTDSPAKRPDIDTQCAKRRSRKSIALIKPGGLAGYIGGVTSYRSFIDVRAKTDVYVGFLPRASLERIVDKFPIVLLTMAKRLTSILPRLILHIDFALEWVQVNAGQVLFHQDEESEAIYIVLNGRLRLVEEKNVGRVNVLAEYGQGESVGELEVMTESTRPGTLHAIRDTELVKFPRTLFNSLAQEHPNITMKVSKIIASRMRKLIEDPTTLNFGETLSSAVFQKGFSTNNLRTVAILPVTNGVPVMDFSEKLMGALGQISPPNGAVRLNQDSILNHLGKHAFNRMGKLKLAQYLADLEEKHSLVLYVADTNVNSPWTQTCITQADSILLVALADGSPDIGEYERLLLGMKSTARKTLILLHAERFSNPGLTRSWLRNRMWVNGGHYHMQMPIRSGTMPVVQPRRLGSALKERVQIIQAEIQKFTNRKVRPGQYYPPESPSKGDFNRLARRLCGKSIGLVLGGGGARGIAHIGVIRALEEAGIPVDLIGGTSIGSFVGALYARHADVVPMFGLAKKFAGRMASIWRFAFDLTYPSASYTTGHEFNRGIFKIFGNTQIEDFWLEYYCNTTNISKSRQEIHTNGYAWRYIRASMSLAGLLPPLCDEGSMLLDGGYIDNLTVAHMKSLGAATIIAVDVGAIDDSTPQTYGDSLSGLWAFFNRWNPLSSHPNPPTLSEIQARLAYVSSVDALERAKMMPGCIYMRPPIDDYGTLDFGKFDEIYNVGYEFGKDFVEKLRDEGKLPLQQDSDEASKALHRTMAPRRASI